MGVEKVESTEEAAEILESRPSPAEQQPKTQNLEKETPAEQVRVEKTGGDPDAVGA